MEEDLYGKVRQDSWNASYDCAAMRYIFEKRSDRLKWRVTLIKAFGVIVPAAVGITTLGYGLDNDSLKKLIIIAVPVTIFQFIISLWAIIYNWDGELSYSYEAIQSYNPLYKQYHDLANYPPKEYDELKNRFDLINKDSSFREQQDASHNVKQWEKRMGMRFSLREYKLSCYGCKKNPLSLKSTPCNVCGKFSLLYKTFNL